MNDNKYIGEFKDGKRNGIGTFTLTNGNKYIGEFKNEKYDGFGSIKLNDTRLNEWMIINI